MSSEMQVIAPYFNSLFQPKIVDSSVQRYEYVKYNPVQQQQDLDTVGRIDFQITDKTNYWVLSHARIEHELSLVKTNGAAYPAAAFKQNNAENAAALINSGYNLYDQVRLRLENKLVEEVRYAGITTTIKNLIKYTMDYSESAATNTHWFIDTGLGAGMEGLLVSTAAITAEYEGKVINAAEIAIPINKSGFYLRSTIQNNGGTFRLLLNLNEMFGFLSDNQVVITGNQIDIELTPDKEWNRLIHRVNGGGAGNDAQIKINKMHLWIPKVVPSTEMNLKLLKYLESGAETLYQFHQWSGHRLSVNNTDNFRWDITTIKSKPVAVIVAFQSDGKYTSQLQNGGIFDHAQLNRLYVDVNGHKYPERDLEPTFAAGQALAGGDNFTREYMNLLQFAMKCDTNNCIDGSVINYQSFKSLYPLFVVDVSKRDETIADNATSYRLEVDVKFTAGANFTGRCYAVVITEEMVSFKGVGRTIDVMRLNP